MRRPRSVYLVIAISTAVALPSAASADTSFVSRTDALARPNVVVVDGTTSSQYRVASPPSDTTYDLRGLTSTAYPNVSTYPLSFGKGTAGLRTVVVGGTVLGDAPATATWQDLKTNYDGTALLMLGEDQIVSYGLTANDMFDMFRPRTPDGNLNAASFLLEGCHGSMIRDDAIENDHEMSGTVRNCVFDGINSGVSIGQNETNPDAVTTIEGSSFIFRPMPNLNAPDGVGHAVLFKQMGAGRVVMRNDLVCYSETPIGPQRLENWMPGTYENVTIVLGPAFDGDGDGDTSDLDHPGTLPPGVTQTRDWSLCDPSSPPPAAAPPTITEIAPASGLVGTVVTITGSALTDASAVRFGGVDVEPGGFTVSSDTQITATVPPNATSGPIGLVTPDGAAKSTSAFTVVVPPSITGMSPTSGPTGTAATITGSALADAPAVRFNGTDVQASGYTVNSVTTITAIVPAGATSGPVSVTTPGGTAEGPSPFAVVPPPSVDMVSPASGAVGSTVTITGSGFTGATDVRFNGVAVPAGAFTIVSDMRIAATVPVGATTGPISVATAAGTAEGTSPFTVTGPTTLKMAPSADTYVSAQYPKKNFGSASVLEVNQKPAKNILIRFTVSGIGTRPVTGADLRLYCDRPSPSGGVFASAATTSWGETTVTWATAPSAQSSAIATLGPVTASTWYHVDLTSLVTHDGSYTVRVTSPSTKEAQYSSKEAKPAFRPQLIVTIG
jgi:IPT/TIG domain